MNNSKHPFYKLFQKFIFVIIVLCHNYVVAQNYFGMGVHIAPPATVDNCCNSFIKGKGIIVPAYSFSFKKIWENKRKNKWYLELGITKMGIGINIESYSNDTINIWNDINMTHVGFPSLLFGGGRIFSLHSKSLEQDLSLGLEGSFRIAHSLEGFFYNAFGLSESFEDHTFPFFLRLNAAYGVHFELLKQIPAHIQLYTKLSPQDIAKSPQYIVDRATGIRNEDGKYRLNNSELGLKLYIDLGKEYYKFKWEKKEKKQKAKRKGRPNFRLSVDGQWYAPPATKYYIPIVPDSFSLSGLNFSLTNQIGIKTEIIHFKNENWSTVIGIGFGKTTSTTHFIAKPSFTADGLLIDTPNGAFVGVHIIPSLGLAYKHPFGKKHFQHSISATAVAPISKENETIQIVERTLLTQPYHLVPKILNGDINYKYGRDKVLFGIEYQPELLFNLDRRIFYGIGLVFNYSRGVIAQGRIKVSNGRTEYNGGILQGFSKIGITARIGWNSVKRY
ncbi:MAG TPA: hypothetical protein ENJ95_16805 [Bacteroidetes bacterium]|nr:hypothetical protein [Bacteroidota bacterium]